VQWFQGPVGRLSLGWWGVFLSFEISIRLVHRQLSRGLPFVVVGGVALELSAQCGAYAAYGFVPAHRCLLVPAL
jgi:hypothetical protein